MTPAVSILLPFCNEGIWLDEAISSIRQQTFKDWELLLISNKFHRESYAIAEKHKYNDRRIVLFEEREAGIAHALNAGLCIAKGKYIARMDADDRSHPTRIEKQYTYLESHPAADVVSTRTQLHPGGEQGEGFRYYINWQNSVISPDEHARVRFIESPLAHPTVMFRKSLVDAFGNYDTGEIPEDYDLWLRWMEHGVPFYKIPEYLHYWRDHTNRLSRTSSHYTSEKFNQVKSASLSRYILKHAGGRKIVICGAGRQVRKKAQMLLEHSVEIFAYTDVKKRNLQGLHFIPALENELSAGYFYVSFISGRGKSDELRNFLGSGNLKEGTDFIIAG